MENLQKLAVICGPTASGKSAVAVALAKAVGGEIISADSMQIYRGMNIGTAKITPHEAEGIPHHLIDIAEPNELFSVAKYQRMAQQCMDEIAARGKLPILCGGTGLYIESVLYGYDQANVPPAPNYRADLEAYAAQNGVQALHDLLRAKQPQAAADIHPNNVKRVIRALEILKARGSLPAEAIRVPRYHAAMVGLDLPRDELYRRIDDRVDAMINAGLEEEAAALSDRWGTGCTALQAIGYKEWMPDAQKLIPREDAIETIKRESRRYAKRQLTWFRNREKSIRWFRWDQYGHSGELMTAVIQYVKEELKWKI